MKTLSCNLQGKSLGKCKGEELPGENTMAPCPLASIPPVPPAELPGTSKVSISPCARIDVYYNVPTTPCGGGFKKACMEGWEHEAHASECSGWEPGQQWTEPSPWSWNNQDLSDEETFARLTHESGDGSESNCGPFWGSEACGLQ